MKSKRYIFIIMLALILSLIINNSINRKMSKGLGIHVPNELRFQYEDSHGGFHGDGVTLARAKLSNIDIKNIL